jgi:chorismate-pyruvate lyase
METLRELLWYGMAGLPDWYAAGVGEAVLTRNYRILTAGKPVMLIRETFLTAPPQSPLVRQAS